MEVLRFCIWYMLVGQALNWGIVFFVIWSVLRKCHGHDEVLAELNAEERRTTSTPQWGSDLASRLYCLWRIVYTAVLWPRNVVNMLFHWSDQMKMADALLNAEDADQTTERREYP